jgi:hypothetical protein
MAFNSVETKWNADDSKLHMLMEIEAELEETFLNYDYNGIYKWLGSYRRHANAKFRTGEQNEIKELFDELTNRLIKLDNEKSVEAQTNFYSYAEGLFLKISQKLKEAGIYYREGKNASHAILER